jgi:hypothetical protein
MNSGEISVHFTNSVLVTVVVAVFVLWRYRQAILAGMMQGDSVVLPMPEISQRALVGAAAGELLARERSMRRRLAAAWLLTTAICGLPMAIAYMSAANMGWSPTYALGLTFCYMIAALPVIAVSLAWSPLRSVASLIAMILCFTLVFLVAGVIQRSLAGRPIGWQILGLVPLFGAMAWNQLWMAGLSCLASWPVRLRGVVPITFTAVLVFGLAPFAGSRLTAVLADTAFGTPWVLALGLNGVFMLIALPVGWLAWLRLRLLAKNFENKRFSDAQLLAGTWWLLLVISIGFEILIARERPGFALLLILGEVLLFSPINHGVMKGLGVARQAGAGPVPTLLVLRVFGNSARTARLFDRVAARWRLIGPVTMISAPDVTARTIDAGDYLRWLTGRVDDLFVTSQANLHARLATLDQRPDPDGRFRLNKFCCRDSSWQATVVELMQRADAVVMDVRGVTLARRGCEFELQQLAQRFPPHRLVLIVDETTDKAVLHAAFGTGLGEVNKVEVHRSWHADHAFSALIEAVA